MILEYEGTNYHGWQFQENAVTIQQKVEEAIFQLSGERVRVTGAGRTDAGVHARGQVANFLLEKNLTLYEIEGGMNAYLPEDIVVKYVEETSPGFNARYSAKRRVYLYQISTTRTALRRKFCWQVFQEFDSGVLNVLSQMLPGEHDFTSFTRSEAQSSHKRCIVYESHWTQDGDLLIYRISANRFLHGMVRSLVGTMMDVAFGKYGVDRFREIFEAKNRTEAGPAAPAKGLILEEVIY